MWKRKSKRSKVNKKSPFGEFVKKVIFKLFIVVFLICIIVIGGIKLVYFLLSNMSCFRLSEVYVKNHITLTGKDAFEFTRLNPGINIFALEISALAKEISRRHPEYEDVVVKRIVPNTLIILLKERTPIVQIKMVKFYPVDKNGFIIPYGKDIPYDNLPIVMGIDPAEISLNSFSNSLRIKKAIELMDLLARGDFPWRKNIAKINLASLNDISIFLDSEIEIKFGANIQQEKLDNLTQILEEIKMKSLSPRFIDLRFKDVIIGPR